MRPDPTVLRVLNGSVVVLATIAVVAGLVDGRPYVALLGLPAFLWGVLGVVYPRLGPAMMARFA